MNLLKILRREESVPSEPILIAELCDLARTTPSYERPSETAELDEYGRYKYTGERIYFWRTYHRNGLTILLDGRKGDTDEDPIESETTSLYVEYEGKPVLFATKKPEEWCVHSFEHGPWIQKTLLERTDQH